MDFDYELLDSGGYSRLERFGKYIVDRPCIQADWVQTIEDAEPDISFDSKDGWDKAFEPWTVNIGHITAELRGSRNGQIGIFPEQFDNWQWIHQKVNATDRPLNILNTFSYTGMSTLFASTKNNTVVHVDGAKSAINWAKRNAELSGLSDNKIRWICDDVQQFMAREVRRGRKYDGIILDPPAFGRGAKKDWKIERDLKGLLKLVEQLLSDDPLFVILTCHAPDHFSATQFARLLEKLPPFKNKTAEEIILTIPSEKGHDLPSSFGARIG